MNRLKAIFKDAYAGYVLVYLIFFVFVFVMFFSTFIGDSDVGSTSFDFSGEWYSDTALTQSIGLKELDLVPNEEKSIYAVVPEGIESGDVLSFKMKNGFLKVYLDGELVKSVTETSTEYEKSPGTFWVYIPLEEGDIGKTITLSICTSYNDGKCYLDNVEIGKGVEMVTENLAERIPSLIVCILIIFIGLCMIIAYLSISYFNPEFSREFLYIGLFAVTTATWTLMELKVVQIFTANTSALHTLSCLMLSLIVMPLYLFFRKDMGNTARWLVPLASIFTILNFAIILALHVTGVADLHETLSITHIFLLLGALGLFYANYVILFKNKNRSWTDVLCAIGMISIAVATLLDLVRYKFLHASDSALCVRIALLFYVITLGIKSIMRILKLMQRGIQAELISNLAYMDGLTGLGNRTSYNERVEKLRTQPFTVFMFDVNNLKTVNDTLGHASGDILIKGAATAIERTFSEKGECYRIGGDEFVCLIDEACNEEVLVKNLLAHVAEVREEIQLPLEIAYGHAYYNGQPYDSEQTISLADQRMYECKKEMKARVA